MDEKTPQTEPAEIMGTYGMGPGSPDDKPLTPDEIAEQRKAWEAEHSGKL